MTAIARETCTCSPVTRGSSLLRGPLCARRAVQEPPRGRLCLASPPAPCSVPSCPHTLLWGVVPPEESVSWAGPSEKCGGHWAGPTPASRWLWGQRARPGRRRRRGGFGDSGVLVVLVPPASADRLLVGVFQQLRDLPRKGLAHAMLARVYSSVDCSGFSPLFWIVLSFFVSCC